MADGEYSVFAFFPDESYMADLEQVDAETAVLAAKRLTESLGARMGTTRRVIITDELDCTVFEWTYGRGITLK